MANKEKSITRQKLFSILSNIVDTSDVFCKSSTSSTDVVEPNSISLIDSNDNEYINNTNNNININNLNDDDELQLIAKFSNTDIDDAHTWVEKLIIQLKLENNCEIIDEGDFDESSIIAIFIMDDFVNDINANLVINSEEDFDTMLAENTKKIQYNDKNVDDLISQIETLNQDNNTSVDENINTENNNDINIIEDNANIKDNNNIKDDVITEKNLNIKDDSNDIKDNVNYNENIIVGEQSEVINKQDINEDEINKNDIAAENINGNIDNVNSNIESINIVDETNNDSNISINNDVNANDDNSVICSDDINDINDSNNNINQDTNQDINDENIPAAEINVNIIDNITNDTINNVTDNTNNITDGIDNTVNDINKAKKYKTLSAEDILNNIDPLTGQIRYSSFINTQSNDNQSSNDQFDNTQSSNDQDIDNLTEDNLTEENINESNNENNNQDTDNLTEENNNESNNINTEENINENDNNVQVINVTETTKNLKKTINSTTVITKKTKANVKTNVNQVNSMPPSQGISLRGISNRVSATASDGRIISAAAQVREMLDEIIAKNNMTTNILTLLQDVANCKKEMKLTYPLLMKVNPNLDFKEQASFGGKKRYNKTIIQYCNQDFYVTNHIFAHNVSKIRSYLESLNLIDKKENTSTEPEIADKQKIIQDLINQKVNAPGKITNKQVTDSIKTETLKVDNIKIDNIKIDNIKINDTKTDIKI